MAHIAFHRSSAVRIETVNDVISVFGRVVELRKNSNRIGPPNRPLALETNECDIASAAMTADSNNMTATTRISIYETKMSCHEWERAPWRVKGKWSCKVG